MAAAAEESTVVVAAAAAAAAAAAVPAEVPARWVAATRRGRRLQAPLSGLHQALRSFQKAPKSLHAPRSLFQAPLRSLQALRSPHWAPRSLRGSRLRRSCCTPPPAERATTGGGVVRGRRRVGQATRTPENGVVLQLGHPDGRPGAPSDLAYRRGGGPKLRPGRYSCDLRPPPAKIVFRSELQELNNDVKYHHAKSTSFAVETRSTDR